MKDLPASLKYIYIKKSFSSSFETIFASKKLVKLSFAGFVRLLISARGQARHTLETPH